MLRRRGFRGEHGAGGVFKREPALQDPDFAHALLDRPERRLDLGDHSAGDHAVLDQLPETRLERKASSSIESTFLVSITYPQYNGRQSGWEERGRNENVNTSGRWSTGLVAASGGYEKARRRFFVLPTLGSSTLTGSVSLLLLHDRNHSEIRRRVSVPSRKRRSALSRANKISAFRRDLVIVPSLGIEPRF